MTLNYPHEGLVVPKANAVVGGLIPGCEIATLSNGKLHLWGKIPHVCKKLKKILSLSNGPFTLSMLLSLSHGPYTPTIQRECGEESCTRSSSNAFSPRQVRYVTPMHLYLPKARRN